MTELAIGKSIGKGIVARISQLEHDLVAEVLAGGFRSSKGGFMSARLEKAFAETVGSKYAISFVNGTATMHAGLLAAGIGPGDEVIVPPLTMSSTTFVVLQAGAVPVFADVDPETFQIDPKSIRSRLTPRTKAIIPVALYGLMPDMRAIMEIALHHDIVVIEDDAEAFLCGAQGKRVGQWGHMSSFSFQSSKHLTSGEGGMIVTDDDALAENVRRFNSLGYAGVSATKGKISRDDIQDPDYSRHISFGYNYRMPELCAAVVLGQLMRAEELVERRIQVANLFETTIQEFDWIVPQRVPEGFTHSYWTFAVRLRHPKISWKAFRTKFRELGGDGYYAAWKLTYLEPMFARGCPVQMSEYKGEYQRYERGLCPVAERLQEEMMQFKTNYWDWSQALRQAAILKETLEYFD